MLVLFITGQSLWPIQMCTTSLPPHIRMDVDYLLLGGIWLGPVKPDMNIILEPVLKRINHLDITIDVPTGKKQLKAKLLLGVFDLPAKAMAMNFTQFNGKHGCPYCLDEGHYAMHRRLYLPSESHEPRTMHNVKKWAKKAKKLGKTVFGVKGPSVLSPYIDIVKSVPIDYMHAVLEGVARSLLNYWFDSKYHGTRFYINRHAAEIDRLLLRIKPPHEFRRTPRSVQSSKYWKASELRAWLLFYSLSVLSSFLPLDYLKHLSLLVSSMHILLSTSISHSDIEAAHLMLVRFYELIPNLYPQTLCTMNCHSLIHLCECVQRWGPLWGYSTFGFENLNGYIKNHCHGTKNVLPQIIHTIRMRQTLPLLQRNLKAQENTATVQFLNVVGGMQKQDRQGVMGKITHKKLSTEEITLLQNAGNDVSQYVPVFPRYRVRGVVYASSSPRNSRDSSTCMVPTLSHGVCFGSIHRFCFVNGVPVAIISLFDLTNQDIHKESPPGSTLLTNDNRAARCINKFMYEVKKLSLAKTLVVISPDSLLTKCIHIPVKHSPTDYIVVIPNMFEKH